jgi:hypothetical protein
MMSFAMASLPKPLPLRTTVTIFHEPDRRASMPRKYDIHKSAQMSAFGA